MIKEEKLLEKLAWKKGFKPVHTVHGDINALRHDKLKRCRCGGFPQLEEAINEKGFFMVRCPRCMKRAEESKDIAEALNNWQHDKMTAESVMLQEKLTSRTIDTEGGIELLKAMGRQARREYMQCIREIKREKLKVEQARTVGIDLDEETELAIDRCHATKREIEKFLDGFGYGAKKATDILIEMVEEEEAKEKTDEEAQEDMDE